MWVPCWRLSVDWLCCFSSVFGNVGLVPMEKSKQNVSHQNLGGFNIFITALWEELEAGHCWNWFPNQVGHRRTSSTMLWRQRCGHLTLLAQANWKGLILSSYRKHTRFRKIKLDIVCFPRRRVKANKTRDINYNSGKGVAWFQVFLPSNFSAIKQGIRLHLFSRKLWCHKAYHVI